MQAVFYLHIIDRSDAFSDCCLGEVNRKATSHKRKPSWNKRLDGRGPSRKSQTKLTRFDLIQMQSLIRIDLTESQSLCGFVIGGIVMSAQVIVNQAQLALFFFFFFFLLPLWFSTSVALVHRRLGAYLFTRPLWNWLNAEVLASVNS